MAYDGRFYAERLAAAVGYITEAFMDASDLMAGNKQASCSRSNRHMARKDF